LAVQPRLNALSSIAAAREGKLAQLQEGLEEGFPISVGDALEVLETVEEAKVQFAASPEPYLLAADVLELLNAALHRGLIERGATPAMAEIRGGVEGALLQAMEKAPQSASIHARLAALENGPTPRARALIERAIALHP